VNPSHSGLPATRFDVRVDGALTLPGRVWLADAPRALVALCHGLGEHGGRYAALAEDLVRARCTVVVLDLPGHGEAPGPRGDVPSWTALREVVVPAMFTASRGLPGQPADMPRLLLGHSMGAVLALDFALHHPRELIAVVSASAGLRSTLPPWWKLALANVARVATPSTGFAHGLDESGMSRDAEVLAGRRKDPLVHDRISPRLYFDFNEARQRVLRDARRLAVPALLLHGAADRVTDPRGSLEFSGAAPHGMVRLITYRDAYHELFNDHARAEVLRDLLGWIDAVLVV
jgi:alpha-beta hydrolase superfamily lysophospholipase